MSEYRQAVKRLTSDERIAINHLEGLIGEFKAIRFATVAKGQEGIMARAIETEVLAHLMPQFLAEIQKERNKLDLILKQVNIQIEMWQKERALMQKEIDKFEGYLHILGHLKALSTEGKVKLSLPTEAELQQPLKP